MTADTEETLQRENTFLRSRIQKLEERYQTTLASISEVFFETDRQGRLSFFNQSLIRLTGFESEELLGKNAMALCPEESARRLNGIFREILETGRPQELSSVELFHKKGHTLPLEVSVSAILSPDQEVRGFRGIARDASAKISAEKDRLIFTEQLQQAQKLEAIGTLAAGIAHDFNNLLMGIQGNVSLILLHTEPESPAWKRLLKIEEQVRHGANLTRQLLGFSGDEDAHPQKCSLNSLVQDSLLIFSRSRKSIRVHQRLSPNLKPVVVDPAQIRQAILNICINAASHAMPDGGDLFIETDAVFLGDAFVQAHKLPSGTYTRIQIRDTGVGMDEKTRKRVFEPFFTTREKGRATGMGLASAFSIIKNHQGILSVHSLPGQGCTFFIHLPSADQKQDLLSRAALNILLVDDEDIVRDVAADLLEEMGHNPTTAASGREAIDLFDSNPEAIDLLILDLVMPDMDGRAVLKALGKRHILPPVLISSGYGRDGLDGQETYPGKMAFIQKPFTLEGLSEAITRLMKGD